MTRAVPFDGNALVRGFLRAVGDPRGDELELHMSDVSACDYATARRIGGAAQLGKSKATIGAFALGHAVEAYFDEMFEPMRESGWTVTRGRKVTYRGIVGHIDFDLERDDMRIVVDVTTTKAKSTAYKMTHALKSAGYALAINAPMFAEVVVSLGFGVIAEAAWHWFSTADYAPQIEAAIDRLQALKDSRELPKMAPPEGQEWRCRAYCDALCPRNDLLAADEIPF